MTLDGECCVVDGAHPEALVIRAWLEPDADPKLRVRIIAVRSGLPDQRMLSSTSVEDVCEAVRDWLLGLRP